MNEFIPEALSCHEFVVCGFNFKGFTMEKYLLGCPISITLPYVILYIILYYIIL